MFAGLKFTNNESAQGFSYGGKKLYTPQS